MLEGCPSGLRESRHGGTKPSGVFMFYTYVLQSDITSKYYVGYCQNLLRRLAQHNNGETKSTKNAMPWKFVHVEEFVTRTDAICREKQIKSYHGGQAFKKLIQHGRLPERLKGTVC